MIIVVYDTETSGLPVKKWEYGRLYITQPYILQFAWLIYDTDTQKLNSYTNYVKLNSTIPIHEKSVEIHGLTHTFLQENGRHIVDILHDFRTTTKKCDLYIAHNVSFDKPIIEKECERNDLISVFKEGAEHFCTMKSNIKRCGITREYKGKQTLKYPTLLELHNTVFSNESNGINQTKLHNALFDILLTLRCYFKTEHNIDIKVLHPDAFTTLYLQ